MEISTNQIKELRALCGAGVMECRNALVKSEGDVSKAQQILKEQGLSKVQKKATRVASQGIIDTYIHSGGRVGAMVELNCETDFVARTDIFKNLAHEICMQVAAMSPCYVSEEEIKAGTDVDPCAVCLLRQTYIKTPEMTVQDLINEAIAKLGENVIIRRFVRFELGVQD